MGAFYKYDGTVGIKPGMEISNFAVSAPITLSASHNRHLGLQIATGILALVGLIFYKWSDSEEQKDSKSSTKSHFKSTETAKELHEKHQLEEIQIQNYEASCRESFDHELGLVTERLENLVTKLSNPLGISNNLLVLAAYTFEDSVKTNFIEQPSHALKLFANKITNKPAKILNKPLTAEVKLSFEEMSWTARTQEDKELLADLLRSLHSGEDYKGLYCCTSTVLKRVFMGRLQLEASDLSTPNSSDKNRSLLIVYYHNEKLVAQVSPSGHIVLG